MSERTEEKAVAERVIEAAGGVLWRAAGAELEVAVVHRPKYDDWSLPKGKLTKDEHPVLGSVREVQEETGYLGVPGRPMGEIHYLKEGAPKRVRYWAMRAESGTFEPNAEVDELVWLPPRVARERLLPERDRSILDALGRGPSVATVATWACALVRHGSAGERARWEGPDELRPLDDVGRAQAEALIPLLSSYRIGRIVSAQVERCVQTIAPFAAALGLAVETEPLLSEDGHAREPRQALERLLELAASEESTAICSQGDVIAGLSAAASDRLPGVPIAEGRIRKGEVLLLHLTRSAGWPRIAAVERLVASAPGRATCL